MNIAGLLEADFQGAREYSGGGIGPLFRERRIEEPFGVWEMLSRTMEALSKAGLSDLVSVFLDDEEIELEDDDEDAASDDVLPEDLAEEVRRAYGDGDPASFHLTFTHDDEQFSHVLTIEAYTHHPYDEAGLSLLDRASTVADEEDDSFYDEGGEAWASFEQFMQRLQAELDKSLALQDPELEIWYEDAAEASYDIPSSTPQWAG